MAEFSVNLNNGKTDEKGMFRLLGKLFNQSGVIESTAMTVAAQGTPDMTVKVSGSAASDNAVFINSSGDTYHGWNTASKNVTITSNATGANRYDAIVAYIDTAAGSATANNPAGLKFIAVRSTNTSPATTGDITGSAVGSNPYIRLADVLVGNGVISINSGNITDTRPIARAAVRPTTGYAQGAAGGDHTTTSTSFTDLVTVFTYTAGATKERVHVDIQGSFAVTTNAGVIQLAATGAGVTTQQASQARTASTTAAPFALQGVFDVTAGSTLTVKIQGEIITSGTLYLYDSSSTGGLDWYAKYVAYGNP